MDDFERKKIALEYYEGQWEYRNKHYWDLVIKDIYVVLTIILFPNISDKMDMLPKTKLPLCVFPVFGIVVSGAFCYLLLAEADRMLKQTDSIKEILEQIGYGRKEISKQYKFKISKCIPWTILIFHILVSFLYLLK